MSKRTFESIEKEIQLIKTSNTNWMTSEVYVSLISALTTEKNLLRVTSGKSLNMFILFTYLPIHRF